MMGGEQGWLGGLLGVSTKREGPKERSFHLGLDFGTSRAKLVLRDREAPSDRALAVPDPLGTGNGESYLIPSLVSVDGGRLLFGRDASDRVGRPGTLAYESVKMRALFGGAWPWSTPDLPTGLSADDLAVLELIYLIEIALDFARRAVPGQAVRPRLTMTMGAPVAIMGDHPRREQAVRLIRTAHAAVRLRPPRLLDGTTVSVAQSLLAEARENVAATPLRGDPRDWVRSEAEAAVLWFYRSPAVRPGLYGAVDIGAGSTDASFFRIYEVWEDQWRPEGLAFYSGHTDSAGMDLVSRRLADQLGVSTLGEVRGREDQIARRQIPICEGMLQDMARIGEVRDRAFRAGYQKEPTQAAWEGCRIFLVGGGSRFTPLRERMQERFIPNFQGPRRAVAGGPPDLLRPDGSQLGDESESMLVAYGLSYLGMEVPIAESPETVPPIRRRHPPNGPPVDVEELYPD